MTTKSQKISRGVVRASTTALDMLSQGFLAEKPDLAKETEDRFQHFAAESFVERLANRDGEHTPLSAMSVNSATHSVESLKKRQIDTLLATAWYKKRWYLSHFFEERYYYFVAGYFVCVVLLGAAAFKVADNSLGVTNAIFSSAACMSQSGLSTINWAAQSRSLHVISVFLIFLGSLPFLTTVPVMLRMFCFHKQSKTFQKRRRLGQASDVEVSIAVDQDLEYRALWKVLGIVYWHMFFCQFVGFIVLYLDATFDEQTRVILAENGLPTWWHAFYLSISAFQNNGLTVAPNSVVMFSRRPVPLLMVSFLILAGMTCFPICVRGIATLCLKMCRPGSEHWKEFCFILEHPRRCFTHMFPPRHTLWLFLVVILLLFLQVTCFLVEDWNGPELKDMHTQNKFANAFFQAVTTRTAGLNSVDISALSPSTTFLFLICMYISTSPTVVTMRYSVHKGGHGHAEELDITGRPEGVEESETNTVRAQARHHLTQHSVFLVLVMFLILIMEKEKVLHSLSSASAWCRQEGTCTYGDFSPFKILFEIVSAYGTVGLSLGYRDIASSFSGVLSQPSQLLLVSVMLLGRLRGLPESIDPSVTFTMKVTGKHTGFFEDNDSEE